MGLEDRISSVHLDILKEIGNIGAAHAATSLSILLHRKIDMNVPKVSIESFSEMMEMAGGSENVVASVLLRIEGDASGYMFFVLSIQQCERFIRQMTGDTHFSFDRTPISELGISAFQELGNILAGSYLTALSDFTHLELYPSVPQLSIDMFGAIISHGLIELSQTSDYAIVIDTSLKDEQAKNEQTMNGQFFLLPNLDSFETIFEALGVSFNE
ncbi:chemotaxis protein CheC [Bacillus sp. FJAT-49736]|uniref:chemotaxis protein CheC n=1 Tax=Bacillus sp. FJAT-49736 TaxID=2833582 RepID=UPI001BC90D47|nr:chemotaxis protein CheC [Bacillus sp. FJAT-49736]MBS4172540.1 chemotaxis protein CheC [Bacillus sp. FJAT-49736]